MYESSSCIRSSAGRTFLTLLLMCVASNGVIGCRWLNLKRPVNPFVQPPVCVFTPDATKDEIIAHINVQASQLRSWRSSRVAIQLKQPGMLPVELNADMAVERGPSISVCERNRSWVKRPTSAPTRNASGSGSNGPTRE